MLVKLHQLVVWMLTLPMVRFRRSVVFLHCVIGLGIVRVVVDLLARIVLLMIDLRALLLSELAAVGRTVTAHFVVDLRLSVFVPGLTGSQLSRARALPNTSLLVYFARVDTAHCRRCWLTVILGREILTVRTHQKFVRSLLCRRSNVRLATGCHLSARRPRVKSARPTVEAGPVYRPIVYDHRFVDVRVVNHGGVHIHDRGVICEPSAAPFSAHEPDALYPNP